MLFFTEFQQRFKAESLRLLCAFTHILQDFNNPGVEMFLENQAQVTTASLLWFFHTGWLETGHDCSIKEGDLFGLFIFKKCTVFKKKQKNKLFFFLTLKHAISRGFLLGQMTIWTTESCDIPSVFVGSTTTVYCFSLFFFKDCLVG